MKAEDALSALAALAQERRLAVFRLLVVAGPQGMAAGALAEAMNLSPSAMSFHLSQLHSANLITQRRESRSIIYAANFASMNGLLAYLTENCCANGDPEEGCKSTITNCC